ncbi:MAG TPA: hypothetical protein VGB53_09595 [Rubricoccaceae bacterium]|jgi:hypothetical protein
MGQQQLLLLVFGIIIVGIAVLGGIVAFNENRDKSSRDGLVNDAVRIATEAQSWSLKTRAFGGGNGVPTNVTFERLGFTPTNGTYTNINGTYSMSATATSVAVTGTNTTGTGFVAVGVYGPAPQCVATSVGATVQGTPAKPSACTADLDW